MSEPSTVDSSTLLTAETAKPFVPRFKCSFVQHQLRIKKMWSEKLHDGKRWKPEAQARYAELEDADQLPEPLECNVNRYSSRMCERGTHCCTVKHGAAVPQGEPPTKCPTCGYKQYAQSSCSDSFHLGVEGEPSAREFFDAPTENGGYTGWTDHLDCLGITAKDQMFAFAEVYAQQIFDQQAIHLIHAAYKVKIDYERTISADILKQKEHAERRADAAQDEVVRLNDILIVTGAACRSRRIRGKVMRAWRILGAALLAEGSLAVASFVTGPGGLLLGMLPLWMALSLAQDDGAYRKQ